MITPKNWSTFQHYKTRKPPWIKLHSGLLDNYEFSRLPTASKALAPCIWLLASEFDDGKITMSLDAVAFRMRMPVDALIDALKPLIEADFFSVDAATASTMLAQCKQGAMPERERETETEVETEGEKIFGQNEILTDWPSDYREIFWREYPRKVGKAGALKTLDTVRKRGDVPFEKLIIAVMAYRSTVDPEYTKHPKTWLTNGCWDDEPEHNRRSKNGSSETLVDAAKRLASEGISFGPKPKLPGIFGEDDRTVVRLLPKGGS